MYIVTYKDTTYCTDERVDICVYFQGKTTRMSLDGTSFLRVIYGDIIDSTYQRIDICVYRDI